MKELTIEDLRADWERQLKSAGIDPQDPAIIEIFDGTVGAAFGGDAQAPADS